MRKASYIALVFILVVTAGGCKKSPTSLSGSDETESGGSSGGSGGGGGGGGSAGPALSSTTATIDGQPYSATEILAIDPDLAGQASGLNVPRLVNVVTGDRQRGWGLAFSAPAELGTHGISTIGVGATLQQATPGYEGAIPEGVPAWFALSPVGGSGTVTVATLTETTATGTLLLHAGSESRHRRNGYQDGEWQFQRDVYEYSPIVASLSRHRVDRHVSRQEVTTGRTIFRRSLAAPNFVPTPSMKR